MSYTRAIDAGEDVEQNFGWRLHGVNHRDAFFWIVTQHGLRFILVSVEPALNDLLVRVIEAIVFERALLQSVEERLAIWTGKMEHLFHIDHLFHNFRLVHVPRNAIEHENVD